MPRAVFKTVSFFATTQNLFLSIINCYNKMADEEEPQCKVEYLDIAEGAEPEETNWIRRAGKCRVTYPNGHVFEGTFDAERIKQGFGTYIWMGPGSEEDETPVEKARYDGDYKNGLKHGVGKMVFPNGNVYEGEWFENKVRYILLYFNL